MISWVLDRLPEYNEFVFITVRMFNGELVVYKARLMKSDNAKFDFFKTDNSNFFKLSEVYAWCPIPNPYDGERKAVWI